MSEHDDHSELNQLHAFKKVDSHPVSKDYTRRNFIITLGVGSVGSIVGYFAFTRPPSDEMHSGNPALEKPCYPQLKTDVHVSNDKSDLVVKQENDADSSLCVVNKLGAEVIQLLDGRHTVEDIARLTARSHGLTLHSRFCAQIAYFISQLGAMGFLAEPFYACIVDNYTESYS